MHAKTDSDATSLSATSPGRPPPLYYVQSPSHTLYDDNTVSFHSTPAASPAHFPHSRESSTRFSETLNHHSANANGNVSDGTLKQHGRADVWQPYDVIKEEEGFVVEDETLRRRCYLVVFLLGFLLLFSFFSLALWAAARPLKPYIDVKSITFERFVISAGSDDTGVATEMASVNSTLKFLYRNTATFFGVHVTSTPVDLSYYQINIATGNLKRFYQSRKSQRTVNVRIIGDKIPLYGSVAAFSPSEPVNMTLSFMVRSRAYVLGRLVKPKFYKLIQCAVSLNPKKLNSPISLKKACTYK